VQAPGYCPSCRGDALALHLIADADSPLRGPQTLRARHRPGQGLRQLAQWNYPSTRLKLVLNRATLRTGLRSEEIAGVLSQPIDWWLPDEPSVLKAVSAGQPVAIAEPKSQVARTLRVIARQLGGVPERPHRSMWPFARPIRPLSVARA